MPTLTPLATGILEATALALLGTLLFQLRHRAGLPPFLFLLGALALITPFIAHNAPVLLDAPWAVSYAYAVVIPTFIALVLLLHLLTGPSNARIAAGMPVLAGVVAGALVLASRLLPVGLPAPVVPSTWLTPVATGVALGLATLGATACFEWCHRRIKHASLTVIHVSSTLAGLLLHGIAAGAAGLIGVGMPGASWPAVVALPLAVGLAPAIFVAVYAEGMVLDLTPLAQRRTTHRREGVDEAGSELDAYREADAQFREALSEGHEAARMYRDLVAEEDHGIFVCGRDGCILYANPAFARAMGRELRELLGEHAGELLFDAHGRPTPLPLDPEDRPDGYTTAVRTPTGEQRFLCIQLRELSSGSVRGEVHDLTEQVLRKQAETERDHRRFTLDLLAKDVPNHLVAPLTNLEHLRERGDLDDEATRSLARVHRSLEALDQVLDRFRILQQAHAAEPETLDLGMLARHAAETYFRGHPQAPAITWSLPKGQVLAVAVPQVQVAFENILENVQEHAGAETAVAIRGHQANGGWTIAVEDDGPGIPHEMKERIFDGFSNGNNGCSRSLGLYLARALVERCGGRVWIEDRVIGDPGKGSVVKLWLPGPLADQASPTSEAAPASQHRPTSMGPPTGQATSSRRAVT